MRRARNTHPIRLTMFLYLYTLFKWGAWTDHHSAYIPLVPSLRKARIYFKAYGVIPYVLTCAWWNLISWYCTSLRAQDESVGIVSLLYLFDCHLRSPLDIICIFLRVKDVVWTCMCKGVFDWVLLELVLTGQGFVSPVLYSFYTPVLQWSFFSSCSVVWFRRNCVQA